MAIINGWGRGTWGQLTWGEPIPVTLSAPSAATSALGTVSVVAKAKVLPSGLSATATNGGLAVEAGGQIGVNGFAGVSATGELGHIFKRQDIDESQTPNWTDVAA